ncbi:hypothetical protein MKQ70_04375 [Chitinophaga sedimenti]|uniref:hypothetical protein n=1 Tax=Chitinophaga sedimenti TaxID=2033606 RepID=UPI002004DD2B|nr:hypothetical protein [Chitinophaga sedimenti]MCK7554286.1 hypothetical protein [Chitinophaga sedimenti]
MYHPALYACYCHFTPAKKPGKPENPDHFKITLGHGLKMNRFNISLKTTDTLMQRLPFFRDSLQVIPQSRGANEWRFTYLDSVTASFSHVKANAGDGHHYMFLVYEKDSTLMADVMISGPSRLDTTLVFLPLH